MCSVLGRPAPSTNSTTTSHAKSTPFLMRKAPAVLLVLCRYIALCTIVIGLLLGAGQHARPILAQTATQESESGSVPLLAYYYIWYDPQSWLRAKSDTPLLGHYSSDDAEVMRQHIRWAKASGIDGFIVSWKSTFKLDRRLSQLIDIAEQEGFWLWIIYQGLDYNRMPLAIEHIDQDLQYFVDTYADRSVFELTSRPVVIWSGTWEFGTDEIASITAKYRKQLTILASERTVAGYNRLAHLVDGNAYYWSSVNPQTNQAYQQKLTAMAEAIHEHNGLWIAPSAPGFDARLIGGTTVVERRAGATLHEEFGAAMSSTPDAVGLISWNEFSENSHVEPSVRYGDAALQVVANVRGRDLPEVYELDSSAPGSTNMGDYHGVIVLSGLLAVMVLSIVSIMRRNGTRQRPMLQRNGEL